MAAITAVAYGAAIEDPAELPSNDTVRGGLSFIRYSGYLDLSFSTQILPERTQAEAIFIGNQDFHETCCPYGRKATNNTVLCNPQIYAIFVRRTPYSAWVKVH